MKKLVSLILALVMVFALATTASAATDIVGTIHGNTTDNDYTEGVTEGAFASGGNANLINISVTAGEVQHRYAVDVEYSEMKFSIAAGNLVWDVNALEYVTPDGEGEALENQKFDVAVTNYSDLPVYLTATVTPVDVYSGLSIAAMQNDSTTNALAAETEIASAVGGTEQTLNFDIYISSNDWDAVANYYLSKATTAGNAGHNIATVSVAVAKAPANP